MDVQILFSHLGRVKEADKEGKSLAPVAADLAAKLGQKLNLSVFLRGAGGKPLLTLLKMDKWSGARKTNQDSLC